MRSQECQISPGAEVPRGEAMRTPDDVAAMRTTFPRRNVLTGLLLLLTLTLFGLAFRPVPAASADKGFVTLFDYLDPGDPRAVGFR